jgi:6-phosphogluconolactonase
MIRQLGCGFGFTYAIGTVLMLSLSELYGAVTPAAGQERLYLGTYTGPSSQGIYKSSLDLGTSAMETPTLATTASNPSFIVLHPSGDYLYAVNEGSGAVVAFSVNRASGVLTRLNQQSSGGAAPCHLAVDRAGKNILVANYTGGSVTVLPIQVDGRLGAATAHIQHAGSSPHAHCITLDGNEQFALVCDLGLDRVFSYRFDSLRGTLTTNSIPWVAVPSGAGPRHLTFEPQGRRAYVICELNSTIIGCHYDSTNGVLVAFQTISSLPSDWSGKSSAAEIAIHASGRFLYGSNRGANTVAVFALDAVTGIMTPVQQQPVGQTPRHFALDPSGAFCLVASQDSNEVRIYAIDSQTGRLTPNGQTIKVSQPVCVLPVLTRPPQPMLVMKNTFTNQLQIQVGNALNFLTYQLDQAPSLQPGTDWSLFALGLSGQTNFVLTNTNPQGFLRARVVTDD